jgi:lysozyme family protein
VSDPAPRNIAASIALLIEREGGYVNHPSDRGGPTMFGITEAVARAFGYIGPMDRMSWQMAYSIYEQRYWLQPRFDQVQTIAPAIAEELFDTGVNMGTDRAGEFLQRCLNVLNKRATAWPDLKVDGQVGALTRHALKSFYGQRGGEGLQVLLRMLNALQGARYIDLAERDESQEDFEYGWQRTRVT